MKKRNPFVWILTFFLIIVIAASLFLSSLSNSTAPQATPTNIIPTKTQPSVTPPPTLTPDPCSPNNLPAVLEPFHKLIREFDDAYLLAENTPIQSVTPLIGQMQEIRREAEDYVVPGCMTDLKSYMLAYMNAVIDTLMDFTGGGEAETINQGILLAQTRHDNYVIELSRIMGWTLVPTQSTPKLDETLTPSG